MSLRAVVRRASDLLNDRARIVRGGLDAMTGCKASPAAQADVGRLILLVVISALTVSVASPAGAGSPTSDPVPPSERLCKAPGELLRLGASLDAAQRTIARESDVRIVALGSSSTKGTGASSPKNCYPAQLEAELNRRFHPDKRFEVVNRGVGGEVAADMLARIDSEVLSLKPTLVIWQTGVNDAMLGVPIETFRMDLVQGIDAITASGADVILLDMQYYPRAASVPGYNEYLRTMWEVAQEKGVPLLRRHAFMKYLVESAQFTPAQLLAPDQFHLNDLSYRCLGNLLADAIGNGLHDAQRKKARVVARTAAAR